MHIVDGVSTSVDWPTIELTAGRDDNDRDVLILSGAEPDHNWRAFSTAVVELAGGNAFVDRAGVPFAPAPVAADDEGLGRGAEGADAKASRQARQRQEDAGAPR